jgi:hypothetical protein
MHARPPTVLDDPFRRPAGYAPDDRVGDRVIVRIVHVRRLLSGESNRQQPSQ